MPLAATTAARTPSAEAYDQADPNQDDERQETDGPMPALPLSRILNHAGVDVGLGTHWSRGSSKRHQCATLSGTLRDVNLDREDRAPLHEQVAAEIRRSITEGDAKPGDRLPPARHLAAVMGVNTNTVLRALRALRDEGLLELAPRRGIKVVGTPQQSELRNRVAELVQLARQSGYTRGELVRMVTDAP